MSEQDIVPVKIKEKVKEETQNVKSRLHEGLQVLKTVSVEPAALCMMTSSLMIYLLFQNLFIENVCLVARNNSVQDCQEILINGNQDFKDEEAEIQKIVARQKLYRSFIDFSFPILFIIFVGPWSDHYGRKIPLLITTMGQVVGGVLHVIVSCYYDSMEPSTLNFVTAIPRCFAGGETAFAMAAYSYITDQTDNRLRTVRTGLLNAGYQLGIPLGFALAGLTLSKGLSYALAFGIATMIGVVGVLFVLFGVTNQTKKEWDKEMEEKKGDPNTKCTEKENEKQSWWEIINPKNNFIPVVAQLVKKRRNNGRVKVWLLFITFLCVAAPFHGEFQMMYLYMRKRVNWDVAQFGNFSSFNSLIGVAGVALSMLILSKWLKLSDPLVGFISGFSQLGGCVIYILASTTWMVYLASSVDMMNGVMQVIARSMLSKIVEKGEVGKLFSLMAIAESIVPLAVIPMYSSLYESTVDIYPGYILILSAAFTIPPQLIYLWFIWKRRSLKNLKSANGDEWNNVEIK